MVYKLMKFREIIINGCGEVVDTKRRYPSLSARSGSIGFTKSFSRKAGVSLQSHNTKLVCAKLEKFGLMGKGGLWTCGRMRHFCRSYASISNRNSHKASWSGMYKHSLVTQLCVNNGKFSLNTVRTRAEWPTTWLTLVDAWIHHQMTRELLYSFPEIWHPN